MHDWVCPVFLSCLECTSILNVNTFVVIYVAAGKTFVQPIHNHCVLATRLALNRLSGPLVLFSFIYLISL